MSLSPELVYVAVLFALFVLPRVVQRWGLPAAITSLLLGAAASLGPGWFQHDTTIHLLAAFGIVALFLFAGLDVELADLRTHLVLLVQHLAIASAMLGALTWAAAAGLGLDPRPAALLALALLTPSTGFILDSLHAFGLSDEERDWVKRKAIATELLSLLVLFGVLQSTSAQRFAISATALAALVAVLPLLFRGFTKLVAPFAPRSEFAFLLMLAVTCAFVTRSLGVYYLVGAFVVGVAARQFRAQLPALASDEMLHAVEMFATFFVPFYFFSAGLELRREDLRWQALGYGGLFLVVAVPLRLVTVALHRRAALGERLAHGGRIALAMLPTLVFGLVIAAILRDRFALRAELFGGLVVYTLVATMVPVVWFRGGSATPAPAAGTPAG